MDFISIKAFRVLHGIADEQLVKEHAIPIATLSKLLTDRQPQTVEDIAGTLERHYRLGVLTHREHDKLAELGLRSKMPDGWHSEDSAFARYEKAGITPLNNG